MQVRQVEQVVGVLNLYELSLLVQTGAGHQAVDVRVELQALGPGVQDGDKAMGVGPQAFIGGELLAQGARGCGEEQIISLFGVGSEKAGAQLGRESEGDHEVRCLDQLS